MTDDHDGHEHVEDQSAAATTLVEDLAQDPSPIGELNAEELEEQQTASLTEKMRFVWRPEDEIIVSRIELQADQHVHHLFANAFAVLQRFYAGLRVPDGRGGYLIEDGKYVERWDQLTGTEVERAIMDLAALKLAVAPEVNRLKSKAIYAKMVANDFKDESYRKVVSGTIGDRTARANQDTRQDRYHAFFLYHLWSVADTFLREVVDLMFRLRDIRNWRVQAER